MSASMPWPMLEAISAEHGDAFYVIDPAALEAGVRAMQSAYAPVERLRIHYSFKANPTPALCRRILGLGLAAEVASGLELELALRLGVPGSEIILTGVGRGADVVGAALDAGALMVVDGDRDAGLVADAVRAGRGRQPARVLLRVRVPTDSAPSPRLGMEPDQVRAVAARLREVDGVEVVGVHAHVVRGGEQALRAKTDVVFALAEELFDGPPPVLDLGGALPAVQASEAAAVHAPSARYIADRLAARGWSSTQVLIEPGTAVVSPAVSLVARVLDVREQPGRVVATVAASVLHSSPVRRRVDLPVELVPSPSARPEAPRDPVSLAGCTLIDGDWLALDLRWSVAPGDFVVVRGAGAYSISLNSMFMDPPLPVVEAEGEAWRTVRHRPGFDDVFAGFVG